jgi:hypothetical protein
MPPAEPASALHLRTSFAAHPRLLGRLSTLGRDHATHPPPIPPGRLPAGIVTRLAERGLLVREIPPNDTCDPALEILALMLASHIGVTRQLLATMRAGNRSDFQMDCRGVSAKDRTALLSVCSLFRQFGMIKEFRWNGRKLTGTVADMQSSLFLRGVWLEYYLRAFLRDHLDSPDMEVLDRCVLIRPDGGNQELDVLLLASGELYWFEASTGKLLPHKRDTLSKTVGLLGLPPERCFLVRLRKTSPEYLAKLQHRTGFTILTIEDLPTLVAQIESRTATK